MTRCNDSMFETFLSHIPLEIHRALSTICLHMNRKSACGYNLNYLNCCKVCMQRTGNAFHRRLETDGERVGRNSRCCHHAPAASRRHER